MFRCSGSPSQRNSHRPHRCWRGDEVRLASAPFGVRPAIRYQSSELATQSRPILRLPAIGLSSTANCPWKSFRRSRIPFRDRHETVRLHCGTGVSRRRRLSSQALAVSNHQQYPAAAQSKHTTRITTTSPDLTEPLRMPAQASSCELKQSYLFHTLSLSPLPSQSP